MAIHLVQANYALDQGCCRLPLDSVVPSVLLEGLHNPNGVFQLLLSYVVKYQTFLRQIAVVKRVVLDL